MTHTSPGPWSPSTSRWVRRPHPPLSLPSDLPKTNHHTADALPNIGHACGHNLIAASSVAAALATAHILKSHSLPGRVLLLGTPAEEGGGGGKIRLLHAGAYDDADVSIISHPGIANNSPLVRTTAYLSLKVRYYGRAAHAAISPWRGVNALDALVVAYTAIAALRQQTRPDDVIAMAITDGGGPTNVIHEFAAGHAVLRAISSSRLEALKSRVEACFRAGAEATGARVEIDVHHGYKDHVPNRVLASSFRRYWDALPPPDPDSPEGEAERIPLPPPGEFTFVKASTDQGDVSYKLPSLNVSFAIPPGPEGGRNHSRDFEGASGTRGAFGVAMRVAVGMSGVAVDVVSEEGMVERVRERWRRDMEEFGGRDEGGGRLGVGEVAGVDECCQ